MTWKGKNLPTDSHTFVVDVVKSAHLMTLLTYLRVEGGGSPVTRLETLSTGQRTTYSQVMLFEKRILFNIFGNRRLKKTRAWWSKRFDLMKTAKMRKQQTSKLQLCLNQNLFNSISK